LTPRRTTIRCAFFDIKFRIHVCGSRANVFLESDARGDERRETRDFGRGSARAKTFF
jgi:hypothetical protein